jgi:hypothetical protein
MLAFYSADFPDCGEGAHAIASGIFYDYASQQKRISGNLRRVWKVKSPEKSEKTYITISCVALHSRPIKPCLYKFETIFFLRCPAKSRMPKPEKLICYNLLGSSAQLFALAGWSLSLYQSIVGVGYRLRQHMWSLNFEVGYIYKMSNSFSRSVNPSLHERIAFCLIKNFIHLLYIAMEEQALSPTQ